VNLESFAGLWPPPPLPTLLLPGWESGRCLPAWCLASVEAMVMVAAAAGMAVGRGGSELLLLQSACTVKRSAAGCQVGKVRVLT
jgi:hypothetical protein